MTIPIKCDQCGRSFEVSEQFAGQRMKCRCGNPIQVEGAGGVMDFLCEELEITDDPLLAETVEDWAKATGATPEIAQRIEKRLAPKKTSNAAFMMAMTGAALVVLLIIAIAAVAFLR
ncbi:MAG TPA: hypothetical protein DD670_20300 [Planctomycetaceae bacterium]|nr:hypothetical protein [Planctomycetaceae bacterium]